ncbi:hypothetical protein ACFQ08_05690 [Streptosporangium algeriense]|uniref:Uncharacterized protein n=1 Tax=Streptosporangium algeriense TaxID=1682748 RepID=A0ABW3DN22_9ACTN
MDFGDPAAMGVAAVLGAIDRHTAAGVPVVVVEGVFALTLPPVRSRTGPAVWADVSREVGLVRKLLRELAGGADVEAGVRGCPQHGRCGYERHVESAAGVADLRFDGRWSGRGDRRGDRGDDLSTRPKPVPEPCSTVLRSLFAGGARRHDGSCRALRVCGLCLYPS